MMNVLGLSLLLTSLAAAGVFSPSPSPSHESTIVKEGHRVVVVEYDEAGHHNTKISISPPPQLDHDKMEDAASSFRPNMGGSSHDHTTAFLHAPKEVICDAYGTCKDKIASAMGKAKDKAQQVADWERDAIAAKRDALGKAKDKAHEFSQDSGNKARTFNDDISRNVSNAKDAVKRYLGGHSLMGLADLIGFSTAYGMCVWVTFISSYVLSRAMPRQQFAVVQSKIYPVYFRAMAYTVALSLLGHVLGHTNTLFSSSASASGPTMPDILQAFNLLASLLTLFLNSLYLEPRATKLMFERMKMEKEEGRGRQDLTADHTRATQDPKESTTTATAASPTRGGTEQDKVRARIIKLNEKLKKFNQYSSILNILNLMSLTWHLVYLAQRLHRIC